MIVFKTIGLIRLLFVLFKYDSTQIRRIITEKKLRTRQRTQLFPVKAMVLSYCSRFRCLVSRSRIRSANDSGATT